MRINTNTVAMNTFRQYAIAGGNVSKSIEKLSTGLRVNSAADDAASLAISEKMKTQIRGLDMASRNVQDSISLLQTAEGAISETQSILQRMNELAVQSASDTNASLDRSAIQAEVDQLAKELNDISNNTTFNNMNILDGSLGQAGMKAANTSTLRVGTSFGNSGTSYSVYANTGMTISRAGSYNISFGSYSNGKFTDDSSTGYAQVSFTDAVTRDVTNTAISASDLISSTVSDGSSFSLNLGNAGLGTYTIAAANGAGTASQANFISALDGKTVDLVAGTSAGGTLRIQSGAQAGETVDINLNAVDAITLGVGKGSVSAGGSTTATGTVTGGTSGTTTLQKTDGTNVTSSVTGTPAFETNGEDITLTYTQGTPGTPSTPLTKANFTSLKSYAADLKTLLSPTSDAQFTISLDGVQTATITAAALRNYPPDGVQNGSNMCIVIRAVMSGSTWIDSPGNPGWGILSQGTGSSASVNITVSGSSASERSAIETLLNMTGDSKTVYGTDSPAVPGTPSTVTIADGSGHSVVVPVNDSDTSFSGSDYFSGLDVNLAGGKTLADLNGGSASKILFANVTGPNTPSAVGSVSFGSSLGSKITNGANLTFTYSSGNVTISNGTPADDQMVTVNAADTSFTVSSGNYQGITVSLASGKTASDLTSGTDGVSITFSAGSTGSTSGSIQGIDVSTREAASAAITAIRNAINTVSNTRAYIGAMENRLSYKLDILSTASQNLSEANSRIRDVDIAKEMTEYTKNNIQMQAATAMLAQANQAPEQVLSLLK